MNCNGTIEVTCNKCGMKQQISCSDFNEWDEVSEDEGAAGKEVQNESTIEYICSICQNKIEIKVSVWTYPDAPGQRPDCFSVDSVRGGVLIGHDCNCF